MVKGWACAVTESASVVMDTCLYGFWIEIYCIYLLHVRRHQLFADAIEARTTQFLQLVAMRFALEKLDTYIGQVATTVFPHHHREAFLLSGSTLLGLLHTRQ
jgi:hypothetical protein